MGSQPALQIAKKGAFDSESQDDKIYQLLAHGWWFPPGTPASSTTKTGGHESDQILLKVVLNIQNLPKSTD